MKRILLSLVAIATLSLTSFGQAPEGFKYQAVVRDAGNLILNNQAVGMQLTIQQGSVGGTAVYTETFTPTTNGYGLVNLEIGSGTTTDDFTTIDWANGPFFMETAVDVTGGTSYAVMGTSQLMSVPYALYAKTSGGSPTYTIGLWPELGGYVFWVSADGKHGLVAETQDQGTATWYEAQNLISNPSNHSVNGQKFRDWRLPTKYELNEMYLQQLAVGGFASNDYWSSTENDYGNAWLQFFYDGNQNYYGNYYFNLVRSVRAF
jgi:hypothetical protein